MPGNFPFFLIMTNFFFNLKAIAEAKINPLESIPTIVLAFNLFTSFDIEFTTLLKILGFDKIVDIS